MNSALFRMGGRTLGTFLLILSFVLAPLGAVLAAGEWITLNSFSGPPGVTLAVTGGGFESGDTIRLYRNSVIGDPAATAVAVDGMISAEISVPPNAPQGHLTIIAVDSNGDQASNSYYVVPLEASITVDAPSHAPNGIVRVSGKNFVGNEEVRITLAGAHAAVSADSTGAFNNAEITIPFVSSGLYILRAQGQSSGAEAIHYFWIDAFWPSVSPSAWYVTPGGSLAFSGSGFAPFETLRITEGSSSAVLTTFEAGGAGSFADAGVFTIPFSMRGTTRMFTVHGALSGATASLSIAIGDLYPYAYPSSYYLLPGDTLTLSGGGYGPEETIEVFQGENGIPIASFEANSFGEFLNEGDIEVPFLSGQHIFFRLVGSKSGVSSVVPLQIGHFYPSISPSAYYTAPGGLIDLSGSGFARSERVVVRVNGESIATTTTNTNGSFTVESLEMPYLAGQLVTVAASGESSGVSAEVGVTIGQFYPVVSPSSYYVFPGDEITVTGSHFAPNETVTVLQNDILYRTVTVDAEGNLELDEVMVPFGQTALSLTFIGSRSVNPVTLHITIAGLSPQISLDTYFVSPGGRVEAQGIRFAAGEVIEVTAGSFSTTTQANSSGTTPIIEIQAPNQSGGTFTIIFRGLSSGIEISVDVGIGSLSPGVWADTYYVTPGSSVTFNGAGFAQNESINVTVNGTALITITADASGNFAELLQTPLGGTEARFIFSGNVTGVDIPVVITLAQFFPSVELSTYYAQGGSPLTIFGSGFAVGETLTVRVNGEVHATGQAMGNGNYSISTHVPYAPSGNHTITVRGDTSGAEASATIFVTPVYTRIHLGEYAGAPGTAIRFIGSGYIPNETVEIMTDRTGSTIVHSFTANSDGQFDNSGYIIPSDFTEGELTLTIVGRWSFDARRIVFYVTGQ
jgi:large repetitive protein